MIFILYASLVLGLGLARTMLIFEKIKRIIFAKIFDFKFSHRCESTRRDGVAAWQILPAWRRPAAAWIPGGGGGGHEYS